LRPHSLSVSRPRPDNQPAAADSEHKGPEELRKKIADFQAQSGFEISVDISGF
ncbi:MAG: hypothetical protein GY757_26445, partial [bacterium]|nr:hypothetical protein [bacterium]